jgi:hypothetical protein
MKKTFYAGIGSRKTPQDILEKMKVIGYVLALQGYILRSGGAEGADSAFETGCDMAKGEKEIFLPWRRFNGHSSLLYTPSPEAFEIASRRHPSWDRVSDGGKALHARNSHQILGNSLKEPIQFVVCYSEGVGGTEQALRLADELKIYVINLHRMHTENLKILEVFGNIYRRFECANTSG